MGYSPYIALSGNEILWVPKYIPSRKLDEVLQIHVTDYYSPCLVDSFRAYYVPGRDSYGPMGRELVAFEKEADAGKSVLRFQKISRNVVMGPDWRL